MRKIWQSLDLSHLRRWLIWSVFIGKSEEETGTHTTQQYPATSREISKCEIIRLESDDDDELNMDEDQRDTESTIVTSVQIDVIKYIQID